MNSTRSTGLKFLQKKFREKLTNLWKVAFKQMWLLLPQFKGPLSIPIPFLTCFSLFVFQMGPQSLHRILSIPLYTQCRQVYIHMSQWPFPMYLPMWSGVNTFWALVNSPESRYINGYLFLLKSEVYHQRPNSLYLSSYILYSQLPLEKFPEIEFVSLTPQVWTQTSVPNTTLKIRRSKLQDLARTLLKTRLAFKEL